MNAKHARKGGVGAALALAAAVLVGCASNAKDGAEAAKKAPRAGTVEAALHIHEDKAAGTKTLALQPQPMDCVRRPNCPSVGVRWTSQHPNRAQLLIGVDQPDAAMQVRAIEFQMRGFAPQRVQALAKPDAALPAGVTAFAVPMTTLERLAVSKGIWVRVYVQTPAGERVLEENMLTGETSSRAHEGVQRLMAEAYRGTDKELATGLLNLFADPNYKP